MFLISSVTSKKAFPELNRFFAPSCFTCFFVSICSRGEFRDSFAVFDGMFSDRFISSQWNERFFHSVSINVSFLCLGLLNAIQLLLSLSIEEGIHFDEGNRQLGRDLSQAHRGKGPNVSPSLTQPSNVPGVVGRRQSISTCAFS